MKSLIKKIFKLNDEEVLPLSILIVLGFFMGIFSATYSVAATTLFLNNFDEKSDLPEAFIISGIIGVISAYSYSYLQKKIAFKSLILIYSGSILLLVGGVIMGFSFYTDTKDIVFLSFVLITPIVTHLSLIFWGIFGRLFDVSRSKKIIGNVDSGQLLASTVALFSIPLLLTILSDVKSLIIISFGSSMIFFVIIIFIVWRRLLQKKEVLNQDSAHETKSLRIFKNPYILLMATFVMVSMIAVKFVDYSFLNVASAQFGDEKSMAFFLSFFEGAIVILSLIFQTFFTDKIVENYGLKVSLLITPIILLIFITLSSLIGLTLFDNYGPQSPTFLVFFIFIALSRMFSLALKDALDGPAFKLYFMPLDKNIRFDAQIKIDGVVNILAGSVAGAFLFLFDRISWINFLHITFLIVPFVVLWYFVVIRLYDKYRNVLVDTLERIKKKGRNLLSKLFDTDEAANKYLYLKKDYDIIRALEITEKVNPLFFEKLALRYQKHKSLQIKDFLNEKLSLYQINYTKARKVKLKNSKGNEVRSLALDAIESTEKGDHIYLTKDQLAILSRSDIITDRILVANALRFLIDDQNIFLLLELLRDHDSNVKKVALKTATEVSRPETWNIIVELLSNEKMANYAIATIIKLGDNTLASLESYFHKSTENLNVLSRIIRIYGQLKTPLAYEYLFKKLDYPNHLIRKEVIIALKDLNTEVKDFKRTVINTTLENELSRTFWNQMAISEIAFEDITKDLRASLQSEIDGNFDIVFSLLGILYDQKSVSLVKKNFENGSGESIAFALELLNIFIDEELKPILFPVIDNLSPQERYQKLYEHFPRENYSETEILQQIIFRESGLLSNWSKVCALHVFGSNESTTINNTIKAQLFNDHAPIRHAALWVIKKKNQEAFHEIADRLATTKKHSWGNKLKYEFNTIDETSDRPYLMQFVLKLKSSPTFKDVSPEVLSEIILAGELLSLSGKEGVVKERLANDNCMIVLRGGVLIQQSESYCFQVSEGGLYSEFLNFSKDNTSGITNTSGTETQILLISNQELFRISTYHEELMDALALYAKSEMVLTNELKPKS